MDLVLYDKKWHRFLRRVWLFKHLPFIDFVLASGSLVLGNVHKDSDFDVLVAVKTERLYTARFFCLLVFGSLGWRRSVKKERGGFCFNHFITPSSFCLNPPYSDYDKKLYQKLIPVFGNEEKIKTFFLANAHWSGGVTMDTELCFPDNSKGSGIKLNIERLLSGSLGNALEKVLKRFQLARIEKIRQSHSNGNSRIYCNDHEVRLWFNPRSLTETFTSTLE